MRQGLTPYNVRCKPMCGLNGPTETLHILAIDARSAHSVAKSQYKNKHGHPFGLVETHIVRDDETLAEVG